MLTRISGELEQYLYSTEPFDPIEATLLEAASYALITASRDSKNSNSTRELFVGYLDEHGDMIPVNDLVKGILDFRNLERTWRASEDETEIDMIITAELDARAISNRVRIDELHSKSKKQVKLADLSVAFALQAKGTKVEEQKIIAKALDREGKNLPVQVTVASIRSLTRKLKERRLSLGQE